MLLWLSLLFKRRRSSPHNVESAGRLTCAFYNLQLFQKQIDWFDERYNTFMAYVKDLVNYSSLDIRLVHERIKELLPTSRLECRLPWLIEFIKRCMESRVWNQDAEVAQIVELIINQALKDGKVNKPDAKFLLSAYGLRLELEVDSQESSIDISEAK